MSGAKRETDRELLELALAELKQLSTIVGSRESGEGDQYSVAERGMAIIEKAGQCLDMLHNEFDVTCEDLEEISSDDAASSDTANCVYDKPHTGVMSLPNGVMGTVDAMDRPNGRCLLCTYHGSQDALVEAGIITAGMLEYADSQGSLFELPEDQLPPDEFGTPTEIFRGGDRVYVCKVVEQDSSIADQWEAAANRSLEGVNIQSLLDTFRRK